MRKIIVLMSTYNGEKYLEKQLDSVLCQEGVEVELLIRDDGSDDGTVDIINNYVKKNENIKFYGGENIGPAKSFLDICKKAQPAGYYAFCDQDDIWDSDKLRIAVDKLEELDQSKPNLYYSNLRLVDADGIYYEEAHTRPAVHKDRYMALISNVATGCTMVINNTCKEYIIRENQGKIFMHDYWAYLICWFIGNTIYDYSSHISYRQHENNVIGMTLDKSKHILKKTIKTWMKYAKEKDNKNLVDTLNSFYSIYRDELSARDCEKILEIVHYKDSAKDRMKLLLDKDIHNFTLKSDINYRRRIIKGTLQI